MKVRRVALVSALVALLGALAVPATAQDATGTFSGTAAADGVRVNVAVPDYLLIRDFVDGGGPSAQAVLDSLGVSRAFSSFPYPGELGVAATGLVSTLTGFSLPSYPLIATSDFPVQPERNIDQPGFHLNAKSDSASTMGAATFGETTRGGTLEGGGFANASVTTDDRGGVVARAETRFSLQLGPVAVRGVRATATVTRGADGRVDTDSSLTMGSLDIGGVEVGLTERGLVLAGAPLVPIDVLTGFTQALTLGTTKLRFLPETVTDDSVLSAGLEITTSVDLPAVGHPLLVSYRLGNVFARATGSAFALDAAPSLPLPDEAIPSVELGTPSGFDAPAAVAGSGTAEAPVLGGRPTAVRRQVGDLVHVSSWTFFPVLALAGLALLAGTLGERWQHSRDTNRGDS
jgi:hypothetical protein